jgi:hypothetical protein
MLNGALDGLLDPQLIADVFHLAPKPTCLTGSGHRVFNVIRARIGARVPPSAAARCAPIEARTLLLGRPQN